MIDKVLQALEARPDPVRWWDGRQWVDGFQVVVDGVPWLGRRSRSGSWVIQETEEYLTDDYEEERNGGWVIQETEESWTP